MHTPFMDGLLAGEADEIARLLQRAVENTDYLRRVGGRADADAAATRFGLR